MCEVDDHDRPGSKLVKQGKEGLRELVWTGEVVGHTRMALRGRGAVLEQGSLSQRGCQLKSEMLEFRFQRCIVHVDVVTQGDAEGVGIVEKTAVSSA